MDLKEQLYRLYLENEYEIPMVEEAVGYGFMLMGCSLEIQVITHAAVQGAVDADIDPMIFDVENVEEYFQGGMLFFAGKSEEWEYKIVGFMSNIKVEGSYAEGWFRDAGRCEPYPKVDVMRKTIEMDHWQVFLENRWIDDGPPVGYLEGLNDREKRKRANIW